MLALGLGSTGTTVAVTAATLVAGAAGGYGIQALRRRRHRADDADDVAQLRETVAGLEQAVLVVPENPSIDALAAALGIQHLCREWGVPANVAAAGEVTAEDARAFCNIFEIDPVLVDDSPTEVTGADGAIAVGGGGQVPNVTAGPGVVAVIRHRPAAVEHPLVISRADDGATATTVTHLFREEGLVPDQRAATALLYGVRAGTREFRRVGGHSDYDAASFLHDHADHGRIDALRSPGMSGETFDVLGEAIGNRERRANFCVTNVSTVPGVSALEEAADALLRLDGVSCAAVFGVHDGTVVVACRAEDVRTSALDVLAGAFDYRESIGGNADAATVRIPLGLFGQLDGNHQQTLDSLIDASTRKALFSGFEGA